MLAVFESYGESLLSIFKKSRSRSVVIEMTGSTSPMLSGHSPVSGLEFEDGNSVAISMRLATEHRYGQHLPMELIVLFSTQMAKRSEQQPMAVVR